VPPFPTVEVTCDYGLVNNRPARGRVTVKPLAAVTGAGAAAGTVLTAAPVTLNLTDDGTIRGDVVTNSASVVGDLFLEITERLEDLPPNTYTIHPESSAIDLSTIARSGAPDPPSIYLLASARSAPNGVASLDGTGKVPTSELPASAGGDAVETVAAGDPSITIGGTATNPTVIVGTVPQDRVTSLTTDLAAKQPFDSDLTNFASLTPANDDVLQRKSGTWTNRTIAQLLTDLDLSYTDISGTVPTDALPAIVINDVFTVDTQAEMLALPAQTGDMAIRTDNSKTYVLSSVSPSTLADWKEILSPGAVASVAGRTGVVVLAKTDVGLSNADNTSDANKPVSTATQTALDLKAASARTITAGAGLTGGGDLSANRTLTASFGSTSGTVCQGNDSRLSDSRTPTAHTHPTSDITGLATAINPAPVDLVDAATIATDASTGRHFRVTLAGNRTLGNPTNPTDGQRAIWEITQDGTGGRTIALGSAFALGADISSVTLSTAASKTDFIGAVYRSSTSKWHVIALARGY
jgi:hypothetical protein